jgi:hypothetical protein
MIKVKKKLKIKIKIKISVFMVKKNYKGSAIKNTKQKVKKNLYKKKFIYIYNLH